MAAPSEAARPVTLTGTEVRQLHRARGPGWRVRLGLARLRRLLRSGSRRLMRLWRVSLQFRVVAITMLLGLAVVFMVGSSLLQSIADGLTEDRLAQSQEDAAVRAQAIQLSFNSTDKTDIPNLTLLATDIVRQQAAPGDGLSRQIVLTPALSNVRFGRLPTLESGPIGVERIPLDLRQAVGRQPSRQQVKLVRVPDPRLGEVPAAVIGSMLSIPVAGQVEAAGQYELYFIYPMQREEDSLALVRSTFLLGGLALVLLLGVVAYVVSSMVVRPVRRAATVAERLSAGALHERMRVRGEDDIARLARTFNEMAENLQRQIVQLETLSRVQQRFVSDVSHELRTPLTTIRMAGDLIHDSRQEFDPAVARSAELLHHELDRFESLLADLLEISRFDAGAAALDAEAHDVRETVARAVEAAEPLAQRRGIPLVHESSPRPCVAEVDPRRIERIVRNLIVNAIEHGEGRPVVVRTGVNATAVAVSVRDHGVGLRPGEADRVFDRFWRADLARTRTTGGTGLGLAISLEDARLHDGWLEAWGKPGEGSCFRLTLPRRSGMPIQRSPLPLAPDDPAGVDSTIAAQPGVDPFGAEVMVVEPVALEPVGRAPAAAERAAGERPRGGRSADSPADRPASPADRPASP
ncbi:MAG TPA: MtrAB system histidine kinase MtrB [Dermatophilaceae bacterium]|nr:MtrAB system histidine kinase MtrB [Dermatophilaceae bacterium]